MKFYGLYILSISVAQSIEQLTYGMYKDLKDQIGVVPYTIEQKIQVAKSVSNLFNVTLINKIYVNTQSKLESYKPNFPNIDPKPRVAQILGEVDTITDLEFHYKFVDLFMSLRDFHTSYQMPGPHKCVSTYKALKFDIIGEGENESIVVSGIFNENIYELSPTAVYVTIGDKLIAISGIPIRKYLSRLEFTTGGANEAGSLRAALQSLSKIDGETNRLPLEHSNIYEFEDSQGKIYLVKLPWIAVTDIECWMQSNKVAIGIRTGKLISPDPVRFESRKTDISSITSRDTSTLKPRVKFSNIHFHETSEHILKWAIHRPKSKNLGVIVLESFEPESLDLTQVVDIIRSLLLNELSKTSALLFDVRSNSGGMIKLADIIPQLFKNDIKLGSFRALVSEINKELFLSRPGDEWETAYRQTRNGDSYSPLVKMTKNIDANRIGQAYTKPVGVFTNGNCYSACDMFAANMKDNNIATIFGEDTRSGGGGANVVEYNSFLSHDQPKYFPVVPFLKDMPKGAQDFRVAWKQILRLDGSLIEDKGVSSEYIIRPKIRDFLPDSLSTSQYNRIADILMRQGIKSGQTNLNFQLFPVVQRFAIQIGTNVTFTLLTAAFKQISIIDDDNRILDQINIDPAISSSKSSLILTTKDKGSILERYNIQGLDFQNKIAYSTWRIVQYTPQYNYYLRITASTSLMFTLESRHIGLYEYSASVGSGWTKISNYLTIGPIGAKNIESIISFFLNFDGQGYLLCVKGKYLTEIGRDFIKIGYVQNGVSVILFDSVDAVVDVEVYVPLDHYFEMPAGHSEFYIHYKSDDTSISGATIDSITVMK